VVTLVLLLVEIEKICVVYVSISDEGTIYYLLFFLFCNISSSAEGCKVLPQVLA
jgi:hypothetical protein